MLAQHKFNLLRRMMKRLLILVFLSMCAANSYAYEKILLPVSIGFLAVPGAHGSQWMTELVGHNPSAETISVAPAISSVCLSLCVYFNHGPGTSFTVRLSPIFPGLGAFVYVHDDKAFIPAAESVRLSLRVQDVSRQALTWGTELPVVREKDLFLTPLSLLNVPTDERFRQTLRIYDFDGDQSQVRLLIYTMAGATPIVDSVVTLAKIREVRNLHESVAQATFADLRAAFPELPVNERLRIEVQPITTGLRFWAFVSVTNNETQHITTVTPD